MIRARSFILLVTVLLGMTNAAAQTPADPPPRTIQAVRLAEPLRIDARLDEEFYAVHPSTSDFIQVEPEEGAPATEKTEVWIAFDDDNIYISFRCWESQPARVIATDMLRDYGNMWRGDDMVYWLFDTFLDRRNGFEFGLNPVGGRQDAQMANERQWIGDWNTVWDFSADRFANGWVAEAAIPFKSLRYGPGETQVWGFNAMRTNRWKNELSFLAPTPQSQGQGGIHMASRAAHIVGLIVPAGSKNLEIKPYAIANASSARGNAPAALSHDLAADVGADLKYGVTQNLTADATFNTDFAQVEVDQQQVNLTRFSLFFPEKREFFLENQGMFTFSGVQMTGQSAGGDTPILFYSRRIGLEGGRPVPIDVGGRLTGRVGRFSLGLLNIQTGQEPSVLAPSTNFSVVRVKRDLLRRSSVGLLFTGRRADRESADNAAYGVDATLAFFENLAINSYWARTATERVSGRDTSYRGQLDYRGDRYGVLAEHLLVGEHFSPGVGFVRRPDIRKSFGQFRFSPRAGAGSVVRKWSWIGTVNYVENGAGRLDTREQNGEFAIEFQNADRFSVAYNRIYEFLPIPFGIASDVILPVGGYGFDNVRVGFNRGAQQRLSGNLFVEYGTFYNGHKATTGVTSGRMNITPRLSVEPTYSIDRVDLLQGAFTNHLAGARFTYTPTPLMFASAFVQFNSSNQAMSSNIRLRWEYRPGSELFVVYNDERDTTARRFPDLTNRAFIVKVNRLLRF
jgi:hypothetical protein